MDFAQAHSEWLDKHIGSRKGERRGRLMRGHQYAEKLLLEQVWWQYSERWSIYTQSMRFTIGIASLSFSTLLSFQPMADSALNVMATKVMSKTSIVNHSATRSIGILS